MPKTINSNLPAPGKSCELLIDGAAGAIEVLLAAPKTDDPAVGIAVICHPHPLFGGAMSNKVVYSLATTALRAGYYTLRFNFRGVGRSAEGHDEGRGETDDVVRLVEWLREQVSAQLPDAPLLLAGFSFGAFVSIQAAARVKPKVQVSIAPPFGKYFGGAPRPPRPAAPWLVVHGRDDDVVSYTETLAELRHYSPQPELVSLDGTGHFFHGKLGDLQNAVSEFLARHRP